MILVIVVESFIDYGLAFRLPSLEFLLFFLRELHSIFLENGIN